MEINIPRTEYGPYFSLKLYSYSEETLACVTEIRSNKTILSSFVNKEIARWATNRTRKCIDNSLGVQFSKALITLFMIVYSENFFVDVIFCP